MDLARSHAHFATTHWTLMGVLRDGNASQKQRALEVLVQRYWPPVFAWLRRSGLNRDKAEELTQAFFADVVLSRNIFERADPAIGHLRAFLLSALKNYRVDHHRRNDGHTGKTIVSLDDIQREEQLLAAQTCADADAEYDRRWALSLLEAAVDRCREHMLARNKDHHWRAFETLVLKPAISGDERPARSKLVDELSFDAPEQISAAVQVVKKRLAALLQEVVAETVGNPGQQQQEYSNVISLLQEQ